ncbi:MAG: hypothetical protein RID42_00290 [Alphaproteobacteria bacterium]
MSGDPWAAAHAAIDAQGARGDMGEAAFARLLRDYRAVFSGPAGERVLADLDRLFGGATYVVGDPTESHARSAQRGVVLRIRQMTAAATRADAPGGAG